MTEKTALDTAHAAMEAAPENDTARLRFYERLADSELFLMLKEEPRDDQISPDLFDLPEARVSPEEREIGTTLSASIPRSAALEFEPTEA